MSDTEGRYVRREPDVENPISAWRYVEGSRDLPDWLTDDPDKAGLEEEFGLYRDLVRFCMDETDTETIEFEAGDGATFKVVDGDWIRRLPGQIRPCSDEFFRSFYRPVFGKDPFWHAILEVVAKRLESGEWDSEMSSYGRAFAEIVRGMKGERE